MGYDSRVRGQIAITPPLAWHEYRKSEFRAEFRAQFRTGSETDRCLALKEIVENEQTNYGETTVRTAVSIVARPGETRFYTIRDELTTLAQTFPSHIFDGYLVRTGVDCEGDVERYWIDGTGAVQSEQARLIWPDGSDVE